MFANYQNEEFWHRIAQHDKAFQIDLNSFEAYHMKVSAWIRLEKYNQATDPNFSKARIGKGTEIIGQKKFEEALDSFPRVVELSANCSQTYYNKTLALSMFGKL